MKNIKLPALKGSEEQITFAGKIRFKQFNNLSMFIKQLDSKTGWEEGMREKFLSACNTLASKTSAQYWIDNRSEIATSLCFKIMGLM